MIEETLPPVETAVSDNGISPKKKTLIEVRGLKKHFPIRRGWRNKQIGAVRAVDGLDFEIYEGETLRILLARVVVANRRQGRLLLQLIRPSAGEVTMEGQNLSELDEAAMRDVRSQMQIIFQDPYASLNPRMTVGEILEEPLIVHNWGDKEARMKRIAELLDSGRDESCLCQSVST